LSLVTAAETSRGRAIAQIFSTRLNFGYDQGKATLPHPFMSFSSAQPINHHLEQNLRQVTIDRKQLAEFCKNHQIDKLSLFGSILREDFTAQSDVDCLVEFLPNARVGYFELVRMEDELTHLWGRKVDLRTPQELSRHFRQTVINEAVTQYVEN